MVTRSPCPIDGHIDRPAIDSAIVAGIWPHREIAERYRVNKGDVTRHARHCLAPARDRAGAPWVRGSMGINPHEDPR